MGVVGGLIGDPINVGGGVTGGGPPWQLPVQLGTHSYLIDVAKYRRTTLPARREALDQSVEPGENSLNTQGLWRRSQSDWRYGAGQGFLDEPDSSRFRFSTSKGLDTWTQKAASLHFDTEQKLASANTNLRSFVTGTGTVYWYVADGSNLKFTTDPTGTSPSFTTKAAYGAITDISTDGSSVFVAVSGQKLQSSALGGNLADLGTLLMDTVAYANGRLFGSIANRLSELAAAGTRTGIDYYHINASFVWGAQGAIGTPFGIYFFGNAGGQGEAFFTTVKTDGSGNLAVPTQAMALKNEAINCMAFYGGVFFIGTSKGFRLAQANSNGALTWGPLVAISGGVQACDFEANYVWFAWSNYDANSTGLGRVDPSKFNDTLVPAYASDLMSPSGSTVQGTVQSVVTWGTQRYFSISGQGFYGENTTKVPSAMLTTGLITYGTTEKKVAVSVDLRTGDLPSGSSVGIEIEGDDGVYAPVATFSTSGARTPVAPYAVPFAVNETHQVRFTVARGTTTTANPTLKRWTLRVVATPARTDEIILPIISATEFASEQGEGADDYFENGTLAEYQYLKGLEATSQVVTYVEGTTPYSVLVDAVEINPRQWNDDRSFFDGRLTVRLLTVTVQS